jgi:hypothetical protein
MILVAISVGAVSIWAICSTSTLVTAFSAVLTGRTLINWAGGVMAMRLKELGEIAVNLPYPAIPQILQRIIPLIGMSVFVLVSIGVACRKQFGVAEAYFFTYVAIILVWPFYDPRFWLPVIPFLIAYCGLAVKRLIQGKVIRRIVQGYVIMFVLMGMMTLASDTKMSLAGSEFGDLCTELGYHSTYCAVWHCKDLDSAAIDLDGLRLLRFYKRN